MGRRRFALVALCALIIIAGGWALVRANSPNPATTAAGVPTCPLATLTRGGRYGASHPLQWPIPLPA